MNVRSAFEADAKTTETMEPRMSPFDDPTEFAEAAAVCGAASGKAVGRECRELAG